MIRNWKVFAILLVVFSIKFPTTYAKNDESFCQISREMETTCGKYAFKIVKPLLEYFAKVNNEITIKDTEVKELKQNLELKEAEIANLQTAQKACETKVIPLNSEISIIKGTNQNLETYISSFKLLIADKDKQIAELNRKDQENLANLNASKQQISDIQNRSEICKTELENSKNQCQGNITDKDVELHEQCNDSNIPGWTVIQRRTDGKVDFNRTWEDYKQGFGDAHHEYWIGLERLHLLTSQRRYRLFIILVNQQNDIALARYNNFRIGSESDKYKLISLGKFRGNAFNFLSNNEGQQFSTPDNDNDASNLHCADLAKSGWWYRDCDSSNLNARKLNCDLEDSNELVKSECIYWDIWNGGRSSLKKIQMMIRPYRYMDRMPSIQNVVFI